MSVLVSRCLLYSPVTVASELIVPTQEQLSAVFQKDLAMNVFRDGVFGSFRHISLLSGLSPASHSSAYFLLTLCYVIFYF